jgi:hypothetical protein
MTEREKYSFEFKKLIEARPYLLENSKRFIPLPEYLGYFSHKFDYGFTYVIPPCLYRLDVMDDFEDRIVYTTHLSSPQSGQQLFSLIQVSPETHIYFAFYYIEGKFKLGAEIYTVDKKFVIQFLNKYSFAEETPDNKSLGFGGIGGGDRK